MDLGINNRLALVIGGSSGIGLGIAKSLSAEGARVVIASRSEERLTSARQQVPAIAGSAVTDCGDPDSLTALVSSVSEEHGPIDILVTNTGGPPPGAALAGDLDAWHAAYTALVLAPRVLCGAVVPTMIERGWGRIVGVGSTSTIEPIAGLALSNSHRMATVGFFKTLATEVAGAGITVNTVATGSFATDRLASLFGSIESAEENAAKVIPAGRLGRPEEYGDLVAFLASDRAAFLTGAVVPLDGGALRGI